MTITGGKGSWVDRAVVLLEKGGLPVGILLLLAGVLWYGMQERASFFSVLQQLTTAVQEQTAVTRELRSAIASSDAEVLRLLNENNAALQDLRREDCR